MFRPSSHRPAIWPQMPDGTREPEPYHPKAGASEAKSPTVAFQKVSCYSLKGKLLHAKRPPFGVRKAAFCNALNIKYLIHMYHLLCHYLLPYRHIARLPSGKELRAGLCFHFVRSMTKSRYAVSARAMASSDTSPEINPSASRRISSIRLSA